MFQQQRDRNAAVLDSPVSSQNEPPTTPPPKRSLPSSQGSLAEMTPSQKRMKLIEEALKTPSTPAQSQERTPKSALSSKLNSRKRLEEIQLALSANKGSNVTRSHSLAQPSSPTPIRVISSQPSVPASLSRSLGKLPADSISSEKSDDEDAELWDLVTPPRIFEDVFLGARVGTVSPEKDSQETGPSYPHWRDDDQDNPFEQSSQLSNSTLKPSSYVPALTSFNTTFSDQSAGSSSSTTRSFDEMSDYVAKLERKLLASEKSNSAKARRISELKEIIERLEEANRALGGSVNSHLPPRH
ncbi:hypothetical protein C0995_007987 [Termitomyces sp. Mi166|nr:hypothetical protein C0995_007987 [Termitomyces sp. Mi166\